MNSSDTLISPIVREDTSGRPSSFPAHFPISIYSSVENSRNPESTRDFDWLSFVVYLETAFSLILPTKDSQALFSPGLCAGTRAKANVVEAGLICIDSDHGSTVDDALAALTQAGLAACICTTASNQNDERFRVLIPLSAPVDGDTYTRVWYSVNRLLGEIGDKSKRGAESLFYLPATYECARSNRFYSTEGKILGANDWLDLVPIEAEIKPTSPSPPRDLKATGGWSRLFECEFVKGEWIDDYLGLGQGEHHVGLYRFMTRVAMSAVARGYRIDAGQLEELARELDREDGGWYDRHPRDIHAEAEKAIGFAMIHATPPKPKRSTSSKLPPECDFMAEVQKLGEAYRSGEAPIPEDLDNVDDLPPAPELETPNASPALNDLPLKNYFDPRHVRPYSHADLTFLADPALAFLANRCIAMSDGYYVLERNSTWTRHSSKLTAQAAINAIYQGMHGKTAITAEKIKKFFGPSGGIMVFDGSGAFPGLGAMVEFNGRRYINSYRDTRLRGALDDVEAAEYVLKLIRQNLCDLSVADFAAMFDEINSTEPTLFKWVIHWLASCYVRPGKHIGTALWFVGPTMGVGKGTLAHIMKTLIGHEWCVQADETENERGWNSYLRDKLFVEADEFKMSNRRDFKDMLKRLIGNPITTIAQRNKGTFMVPTVANWLFTTNSLCPIELERDDRRHTLVRTTNNPESVKLAEEFWRKSEEERDRILRGFAAVLSSVEIDDVLLRKPFHTELRADLMAANLTLVEHWFASTDRGWTQDGSASGSVWMQGETKSSEALWELFLDWTRQKDPHNKYNHNRFGREMSQLEAQGYVKRDCSGGRGRRAYEKLKWYYEESAFYHEGATALLAAAAPATRSVNSIVRAIAEAHPKFAGLGILRSD